MTHEEFADFIEKVERFEGAIYVQTNRHLDAGEDQAAGALLLLKARLTIGVQRWRAVFAPEVTAPAVPAAPVVPAPPPVKCRHVFVGGTDGVLPARCSKCDTPKRANGRPRNPPAVASVLPGVAK